MEDSKEIFDIFDVNDKELIGQVKGRPSLYYTDTYSKSDEHYWNGIQRKTGMQKSWLKERWKTIRDNHRRITIYNKIHSQKIPMHRMAKHLNFLTIDLNDVANMSFDDLKQPQTESFYVTDEMLDNCDINEGVTFDSITVPKVSSAEPTIQEAANKKQTHSETENSCLQSKTDRTVPSTEPKGESNHNNYSKPVERCEDTIFGELVIAMLKKMSPEQKKQAKKEIMNILL